MKVLAIETSSMLGGIAIMDDSQGLIAEMRLNVKSTHSERLMTTIAYTLKQAAVSLSDIDVFGIAIGPGSFTGLRIGLSTVKGLSYATGRPIVSVPTLEAFAYNFPFPRYPVCIMLDARKKEVYTAVFKWEDDGFVRLIDETSVRPEEFTRHSLLVTRYDKFIFAGDGVLLYRDKIMETMGERAILASPEKMVPSPANVAYLGIKRAMKGEFSEPVSLVPFYIRKSEAEIKKVTSDK